MRQFGSIALLTTKYACGSNFSLIKKKINEEKHKILKQKQNP